MSDTLQALTATPDYRNLLERISDAYSQGRARAFQAVNAQLTVTYWQDGQHIVEFEQAGKLRAEYGKALLTTHPVTRPQPEPRQGIQPCQCGLHAALLPVLSRCGKKSDAV